MAFLNLRIKKAINFFNKNALLLSILIVIISFLFSRLPFFIWAPIPEFGPDTFDYFYYVDQLNKGKLPSFDFLPPGFIVFSYLIGLISNKIIALVYFQNFIILLASILLVYVINKYYKNISLVTSFAISIYLMSSYTIRYDTALLPESLYSSSLILVTALFIWSLNTKKIIVWLLFSVSLIFPALIRSNGIYIYFLFFLVLLFMLINRYNLKYYLYFIIPFLFINFLWATYNYYKSNGFFIGNAKRIDIVINRENKLRIYKNENGINNHYFKNKFINIKEYLINISYSHPQFYYTFIKDRYRRLYIEDIIHKNEYKMFDWSTNINDDLKKLVYREYYSNNKYKGNINKINVANKNLNLWLLLYHIYYKINDIIFLNLLWIIIFLILFIYSGYKCIKYRFKNKDTFLIFSIGLIYLLSILIVTFFHSAIQSRYVSVTEFIIYLYVSFFFILLFNNKPTSILYAK